MHDPKHVTEHRRTLALAVLCVACTVGDLWASDDRGDEFLAANSSRDGVVTLDSGLQYEIIAHGEGARPRPDDTIVVHYRGTFVDGREFDSSYERDRPAHLPLEELIDGWRQALPLMPVGSTWRLYIPPELGYGEHGAGPVGPNTTLIYDIELLSIVGRAGQTRPNHERPQPIADIRFLFKLDPRLTRSLYMGDRWVAPSPAGYTQVGDTAGVKVEVRVVGVNSSNHPLAANFEWIVDDSEIATVLPDLGSEVAITAVRPGTTRVTLVAPDGQSRVLILNVTRPHGALQVEVHPDSTHIATRSLGSEVGPARTADSRRR